MPKIIFISGIHGSGKTTLGQKLSRELQLPFDSASSIIKKMTEQNWDNEKRVKDIDKNQNILLDGLEKLYSQVKTIILDGHCTLLNKEKRITYLPLETFQNLNLSCIIICTTSLEKIIDRLKERDGNSFIDVSTLDNFQEAEIKHANKISNELGIPIINIDTNKEKLESLVNKIIKGGLL